MDYGIEIYLPQLNTISIAKDKNLVTIGGGTNSKKVTDALWAAGKQTGNSFSTKKSKNDHLHLH